MTKWLYTFIIGVLIILGVVALAGPIGPVPGMRIGGEITPPPADWSAVQLPDEVQLKTSGGLLPRVVNIWIISDDNALYVFGASESGWVKGTLNDPNILLRIGDATFDLEANALKVADTRIYQKYIDRYAADYPDIIAGMPDSDALEGAGVIFRITSKG